MSRATELAEWLETSNSSVDVDAANLLRQQEAVLRQCVEALTRSKPFVEGKEWECEARYDITKDGGHYEAYATARDIRAQCEDALAAAKEVLSD
jgi:hypothetical protein